MVSKVAIFTLLSIVILYKSKRTRERLMFVPFARDMDDLKYIVGYHGIPGIEFRANN